MSKHQQFDDYFDKYSTDIFTEHTEKHQLNEKGGLTLEKPQHISCQKVVI